MQKTSAHCRYAFSLIEMAMVIAITGLMVGFVLQANQSDTKDCYAATRIQMSAIRTAMESFARKNDRLPLPAQRAIGVEDINYGRESAVGTTVAGASTWGAIPFQALGLAPSYGADCWGNKFTYVVTTALTTNAASGGYLDTNVLGAITLKSTSATTVNTNTGYAIISHGEDALGAVKANATSAAWCANSGTLANINCSAATATVADAVFNNGKNAGANYYDDIILAPGKPQMLNKTNLYCWGSDYWNSGNLADGNTTSHQNLVPTLAHSNTMFASLSGNGTADGTCALGIDGVISCWGSNSSYQVGDGTQTVRPTPTPIGGTLRFKKVFNFVNASYALTTDDWLYCWGAQYGMCKAGQGWQTTPILVSSTTKFQYPTGALDDHGGAGFGTDNIPYFWSWGGYEAPKGHGSAWTVDTDPVPVSGSNKFSKVVTSGGDSCGLTNADDPGGANHVYCWGWNGAGLLGLGDQVPRYVPTVIPGHTFSALFSGNSAMYAVGDAADANPGRLYAWGRNFQSTQIGIGGVDGTDYGNYNGTMPIYNIIDVTKTSPATFTTSSPHGFVDGDTVSVFVDAAAGYGSSWPPPGINVPIQSWTVTNATATTFQLEGFVPEYYNGHADPPVNISNISQSNPVVVTTSTPHGFTNGDWIIINGADMPAGNANGWVGTVQNATATTFEIQDRDSTAWGPYNGGGKVGGFMVVAKKPTPGCYIGAYGGFGICQPSPRLVDNPSLFKEIVSQDWHTFGRTDTGKVYGWGGSISGVAGQYWPYETHSPALIEFPPGVAVQTISPIGYFMNCAIGTDKIVYCWGQNGAGQGGDGTTNYIAYPAPVSGGMQFIEAIPADYATCAIKYDPTVDCDTTPVSWGACSASSWAMVNGASKTVTNTAPGHTGTVTVSCVNKVLTQSGGSCM